VYKRKDGYPQYEISTLCPGGHFGMLCLCTGH
jgi:hypothetical protein